MLYSELFLAKGKRVFQLRMVELESVTKKKFSSTNRSKMSYVRRLNKVSVLSVPMNLGQPSLGLDKAPQALIEHGLPKMLAQIGWRMKVLPPLTTDASFGKGGEKLEEYDPRLKNCAQVGQVNRAIRSYVAEECQPDNFPLILGGDHCISIGTISAIKNANPKTKVVWVSQHQ